MKKKTTRKLDKHISQQLDTYFSDKTKGVLAKAAPAFTACQQVL